MGNERKETIQSKQPQKKTERMCQNGRLPFVTTSERPSFKPMMNKTAFKKQLDAAKKLKKLQNGDAISANNGEEETMKQRTRRQKEERIMKYKLKRLQKTIAISKKTQHGQPLMKDRIELLLKEIQESKRS